MTDENLRKKKWLSRYRELVEQANDLQAEAESWKEMMLCIVKPISDMPRNPSPPRADEMWVKHLDIITDAEKTAQMASESFKSIEKAINEIPDVECRKVLQKRYISGYSWYTVSETLHMSISTATRTHGRALELIKMTDYDHR